MKTFIILSSDEELAAQFARSVPDARVIVVPCLGDLVRHWLGPSPSLLVDPLSLRACCFQELWGCDPNSLVRTPGPPSAQDRGSVPPRSMPERLPPPAATQNRAEWEERTRILSPTVNAERVRRFVKIAREHDHEGYTVPQAATALHVSIRQLHRMSIGALGFPPGIVLDLARVVSVAGELLAGDDSLAEIAEAHRYRDEASMTRQFNRFVGITPRLYRSRGRRPHVLK